MLEVRSIRKTYKGGVVAVNNVSFVVEPGKVLGILGPNGAGKSTTIRMILNIIKPDSGEILFRGKHADESIKRSIGYLPEERGLYKKNAIGDALYYFAALKGVQGTTARKSIAEWLERFELGGMEKRKIEELSKGNQQKVQFIASVIHSPELLILDEPFSGLDPVNQLKFKDVVMSLRAEGKAIIFCTHQLESAEKICNDIVLYNKGNIVLSGTVDEVKQRFGARQISLQFEGDGSFLAHLPYVEKAEIFANSAEIQLTEEKELNDILPDILPKVKLTKIEKTQPSLLNIFIETVGRKNLSTEFIEQRSDKETTA